MAISVSAGELGVRLDRFAKGSGEAVARGMRAGARRGRAILVRRSPSYTGQLRASWRVVLRSTGLGATGGARALIPTLENTAPHAGIVEAGARPHRVSEEGIAALTRWAELQAGLPPDEAEDLANAIAWRLRHHGQKPTYFVRDSLPDLGKAMNQAIAKSLRQHGRSSGGR